MNEYSQLFKQRETTWFNKIKPFLPSSSDKVLKIGNGFGHLSELIRATNPNTTILDIAIFKETINKSHITLYSGDSVPFSDEEFTTTILNLTLHHVKDSRSYFKNEILRVTNKRVILIEETYDTIFQKIHLVWRDWYLNKKAGQSCPIHWNSYFSRKQLTNFVKKHNLSIVNRTTTRHHSYFKELIVIDLP